MNDNAEQSIPSRGSVANYPATPDGWISVAERLPDNGKVVLAWLGERVVFGYCRDGQWIDTLYGWTVRNGPTHWMPLPAPPVNKW